LLLQDAFALFRRLGIDVRSMSRREFSMRYYALARRYHPDQNGYHGSDTHELMASINAARTTILKHYRPEPDPAEREYERNRARR
jgi:DnaJ-class molecular chaperone